LSRPVVSVIIATYNRSDLLSYALSSLRLSTLQDWEAIVVGDHCTDDTREVVESFKDSRIRFTNLERNSGQQSTPNNVGLSMARGEFIAFLNHDDLYLQHHLEANLQRMREMDVDILLSPRATIPLEQAQRIPEREIVIELKAFSRKHRFNPRQWHIATGWFLRRECIEGFGPWRQAEECFVTPSQDWLFRAWGNGARVWCTHDVSVIAIYSGDRKGIYRGVKYPEHEYIFREVLDPGELRPRFDAKVEAAVARALQKKGAGGSRKKSARGLRGWYRLQEKRVSSWLVHANVHPNTLKMIRMHGGRGGFIRATKRVSG